MRLVLPLGVMIVLLLVNQGHPEPPLTGSRTSSIRLSAVPPSKAIRPVAAISDEDNESSETSPVAPRLSPSNRNAKAINDSTSSIRKGPARPSTNLEVKTSTAESTKNGSTKSSRPRATESTRQARIWPSQVTLIEDIDVPAPESGLLELMNVRDEQPVTQGQLLATIDSRQQQLQREASEIERNAATAKASDDIEVRYAEASYEKSSVELDDAVAINKRNEGSITQTRIRELKLERERARLQIERSKLDLKVAGMTAAVHDAKVRLAAEAIDRRQIVSPIDGEVIAVNLQPDEWVNAGDTVYRIIRLDRVRVEGLVNVKEYDPSEIHDRDVTVEVELARGKTAQFVGRVTHVNPIVKSHLYRVRAEVENRQEDGFWLLQAGRDATMIIHLD